MRAGGRRAGRRSGRGALGGPGRGALTALAVCAALLAGCGGDDSPATSGTTPAGGTTTSAGTTAGDGPSTSSGRPSDGTTTAPSDPALRAPDPDAPGVAYLALGDSLAQGVQRRGGTIATSREGYPDALAARLRRAGTPVTLTRLGCSGATVASLLYGGRRCTPPAPAPLPYEDRDAATSQLAYAETYLRARGDRPTLVTIDIGANDLLGCAGIDPARVRSCFADRLPTVGTRLGEVAKRLRAAAGPNTVLAAMTYYDPAVALVRQPLAKAAAAAFHEVVRHEANPIIRRTFAREDFVVARVDRAFGSDGGVTDEAVDRACRLTRLCSSGADFHPNAAGYGVIADAFLAVVRGPVARVGR